MSQTATTQPSNTTIRLQNGQVYESNSNDASELEQIPVIDAARIHSDKLADRQEVAEEIREAAHSIGFFYLVNHGVDMKLAEDTFAAAKRFFAQPEERKMKVFTGKVEGEYVGFHPMEYYNRNAWKHKGDIEPQHSLGV